MVSNIAWVLEGMKTSCLIENRVGINRSFTNREEVTSGLIQGSVLGLQLFNSYRKAQHVRFLNADETKIGGKAC